jgi:hypothetical protein
VSDGGFGAFLRESFDVLAREVAWAHAALCATLAPREIALRVGAERVALRFTRDAVLHLPAPAAPAIACATDRDTILAVLDAEATLLSAVLDDRLLLRGTPDHLLAFHDALVLYVHGAVRAPSFPALLRRFRDGADAGRTAA